MATAQLNLVGLKCPEPAMKIASKLMTLKPGESLEVTADCETFEADVKGLCQRWKKTLLSVKQDGKKKTVLIQA